MNKGTILSVDDDANLQLVISEYLEDDGFKVIAANDVSSALEKAETADMQVILLDLVLPDGEGLSLIPQFRNKCDAGIIVVSGKSDTMEKIVCLEMGADDYITKPFEMRELSARIKAVLRRKETRNDAPTKSSEPETPQNEKIEFLDFVLDRAQYQVFRKEGGSLDFTTGEFKLLEALILAPNRALKREHLFELTREGEYDAYDRAIDIQIARIRKKLGDTENQIIRTVRGVGYMFSSTYL